MHSYTTGYYPETLITDIQCENLSPPANGNASCSYSRVGVVYKGDTCSFTCNTGYELTGSDTRTCQSDGSWSGTEVVCRKGSQLSHINLVNYVIIHLYICVSRR